MNKKAISEQVFIYIFVMFVIVAILIFGIKMIKDTTNLGKSVDIAVFQKDFDNAIQTLYTYSEGSSQKLIIKNIPKGIKAICVIDQKISRNTIPYEELNDYLEGNSNPTKNLFFISKDFLEPKSIKYLTADPNPFCKQIEKSTLEVTLVHTGNTITIK